MSDESRSDADDELVPNDSEQEFDHEVEWVSDFENMLVLGRSRQDVEGYLQSQGLLGRAVAFGKEKLVPGLRASSEMVQKLSESAAESGMWVKLTPESLEAIKEFGLTESGVPGVVHAMAGSRGSMKKWLQFDVSAKAMMLNPVTLAGVAGSLDQAAREQEAAELRAMLERIDYKLDLVLRAQDDEVIGRLGGAEQQIEEAMSLRAAEGTIDETIWSKVDGAPMVVRQVRETAMRRLDGIASDLEQGKGIGELNERLQHAEGEVRSWLSVIGRSLVAEGELAVLELTLLAAIAPEKVNTRRLSLAKAREEAQEKLLERIAGLVQRMDRAAEKTNEYKLAHVRGVPKAIESINDVKSVVQVFCDGLGIEVDWKNVDPKELLEALKEWPQVRNALVEAGSAAWKHGKPVLGLVATAAIGALISKGRSGGGSAGASPSSET